MLTSFGAVVSGCGCATVETDDVKSSFGNVMIIYPLHADVTEVYIRAAI